MLKVLCAAALAAVASTGAVAAPMTVTDDPFKSFVRAEAKVAIPGVSGWKKFCFTQGDYSVWAAKSRDGKIVNFGVDAYLYTLRSPGEITGIDLIGGLPLVDERHETANVSCYNGCHNDAFISYHIPPDVARKLTDGDLRIRIRSTSGPDCDVIGVIRAQDMRQLIDWADAP